MNSMGFVRVAAGSPELKVADCRYNTEKIIELIEKANNAKAQFLVLPELCITSYSCADLFRQELLLTEAIHALQKITESTRNSAMVVMVGLPLAIKGSLFNCAAVIQKGNILGIVPKSYIPGYNEFYEPRWFLEADELSVKEIRIGDRTVPIGADLLFTCENNPDLCFGVEICEDVWVPIPPSSYLAQAGAVLLFNLSASNDLVGKAEYRRQLIEGQSARCICGYTYASCNTSESSTDLVYGGHMLMAENGRVLKESDRFSYESQLIYTDFDIQRLLFMRLGMGTFKAGKGLGAFREIFYKPFDGDQTNHTELSRDVDRHPFVPGNEALRSERCHEILSIQTSGLMKRMRHTGISALVLGISGGLDSTLALIVTVRALQQLGKPVSEVHAITMPGFGTTERTYENAVNLIKNLGATLKIIDIRDACLQHFKDIGHDPSVHDLTYENVQARERTQVLMDYANKIGGLVVGTGDMSELALGWCTYNGDQMSMYGVNASVPKTLVKYIIRWYADHEADAGIKSILYDVMDTPISPELLPPSEGGEIIQRTEDILGPYEVHDFFLYHLLRSGSSPRKILYLAKHAFKDSYGEEKLKGWLKGFFKRFFSQQFKRSCMPDGPKVGTVSLSPRGDWRMPSDASVNLWLADMETL